MLRSELAHLLADRNPDLVLRDAESAVAVFFDAIVESLAGDGRVELRGFGVFSTRVRDARIGRNPRNGQTVQVKGKRVPHFKPGKKMRAALNVKSSLRSRER